MVARGNQWYPRTNIDAHFEVLRISTTNNGYKTSKYYSNFKFPIITNSINGC